MIYYKTRTGILIGCMAQKQPTPYHDKDAIHLQSALLGAIRKKDWDGLVIVAVLLVTIGAVAWRLA